MKNKPFTFTQKKHAFTLAEVLITLGIIGIVAALTLPALIQKNNNRVVETRLMKFYSAINQAVKMAEVDYGDKKFWYQDLKGAELDKDGNPVAGSSESEKWFKKYLAPYLKITSIETKTDGSFIIYFPDGSALKPSGKNTRDWTFYPGKPDKCIKQYGLAYNASNGICSFSFEFYPADGTSQGWKYHYNKGFEPWKWNWDGTRVALLKGCKGGGPLGEGSSNKEFCTALIQFNNWTIPDDYPFKVSY